MSSLLRIAAFAGLGGFLFGYDLGLIAGALLYMDTDEDLHLTTASSEVIVGMVRRERPTLRALLATLAGARGHYVYAGTPEQVADFMETWLNEDCADGFNLMPPVLPKMLDVFIAEVVPILQKRGLFRTEYTGTTLREHYKLDRPST